jgi:hypothetical protein
LGYISALFVLAALAAKPLGIGGVEAAVEPVARSNWIALERPQRAFVLLLPEFPNEPEPGYAILRHPGGGRKDVLTWGNPAQPASILRIEIYRPANEGRDSSRSTLEASAPETEELGTVTAKEPRPTIASKFGELALTEFSAQSKGQTRRCVGFARTFDAPRLRIAGWYCKGTDEIIDPAFIACALDRLTLIAAGSDPKVYESRAGAPVLSCKGDLTGSKYSAPRLALGKPRSEAARPLCHPVSVRMLSPRRADPPSDEHPPDEAQTGPCNIQIFVSNDLNEMNRGWRFGL